MDPVVPNLSYGEDGDYVRLPGDPMTVTGEGGSGSNYQAEPAWPTGPDRNSRATSSHSAQGVDGAILPWPSQGETGSTYPLVQQVLVVAAWDLQRLSNQGV